MPTLNEETGFYQGKTVERNGQTYLTECVPTAVANYLRVCNIPTKAINDVVADIIKQPEYNSTVYGVPNDKAPDVIERVLKQRISEKIKVTSHGAFFEDAHFEQLVPITRLPATFIALTDGDDYQHIWVAAGKPLKRLDADGRLHETLRPIAGYLEIKGLDSITAPLRGISGD